MTRKEYMEQLKKYLKRLPKEDYDNAIEYFSEYFDEAGPENEQQVMEELGQPKEAARELFFIIINLLSSAFYRTNHNALVKIFLEEWIHDQKR